MNRKLFSETIAAAILSVGTVFVLLLGACSPLNGINPAETPGGNSNSAESTPAESVITPTALPTRPPYTPGTLVDYTAQTGDTLPALAVHFNTTVDQIRSANPNIPVDATTMPPGMPMKIPIYYEPLWGSPLQIIPDSLFVNGPAQVGFDAVQFVNSQPGWFKNYVFYTGDQNRRGGEIVNYIAEDFSVSPRLLLAILEYQTGALSNPNRPANIDQYPLGYQDQFHLGAGRQLAWAANALNNGYYGWRIGNLNSFTHQNGRIEQPDPWQNAATVGLQYYFAQVLSEDAYAKAISADGLLKTYTALFGDPWQNVQTLIPGSLTVPNMDFPFAPNHVWAFTGGPHTGWGEGEPYAAVDFAPGNTVGGCSPSPEPATAVADGIIAATDDAKAFLDLDGDMDIRTGWVVMYLHLANDSLPKVGKVLKMRDPIGMPSCEGGEATGTHVHIARMYNGEWIPAGGVLAYNLEGWVVTAGSQAYQGTMTNGIRVVKACVCSDQYAQVSATSP